MSSKVDISNQALDRIGVDAILSFTENSEPARKVNLIFDDLLNETVQEAAWNFAVKRVELPRLVDTPIIGFNYKYQLPNDCLQVLRIITDYTDPYDYDSYSTRETVPYKIEGRELLTDEETVYISYIKEITDVQELSNLFRVYFTTKLAHRLCYGLTGNASLQDRLEKELVNQGRKARKAEAMEIAPKALFSSSFIDLRYSRGNKRGLGR